MQLLVPSPTLMKIELQLLTTYAYVFHKELGLNIWNFYTGFCKVYEEGQSSVLSPSELTIWLYRLLYEAKDYYRKAIDNWKKKKLF